MEVNMEVQEGTDVKNNGSAPSEVQIATAEDINNVTPEESGNHLGNTMDGEANNTIMPQHFLFSNEGLKTENGSEGDIGMYKSDGQDPNTEINMESVQALENFMMNGSNGSFYMPSNKRRSNIDPSLANTPKHLLYTRLAGEFGKDKFTCNICNKEFKEKRDIDRHIRIHTGEKPYECNQCGWKFTSHSNLKRHKETHIGEKPYVCNICNRPFARREYLDTHILLHSDNSEKPFPCHICGKGYVKKSYLERHLKSHVRVLQFFCHICGEGYHDERGIVSHMARLHSGVRPFPCSICKQEFRKEHLLKKHMKKHTDSPITPEIHQLLGNIDSREQIDLEIESQQSNASREDNNQNELQRDTAEKIQDITECQKLGNVESLNAELEANLNKDSAMNNKPTVSANEGPLENNNNKTPLPLYHSLFQSSSQTSEENSNASQIDEDDPDYSESNSADRPFCCSLCKKSFTKKTYLEQHMFTHGDLSKRPFQCNLCNNGFTKKSHYVRHMKSHSKVLEFFCEICGKGYFEKRGLTRHIATKICIPKTFPCTICEQEFEKPIQLEKHMEFHVKSAMSLETPPETPSLLLGRLMGQNDMADNMNGDQEPHSYSMEVSQSQSSGGDIPEQNDSTGNMSDGNDSTGNMSDSEESIVSMSDDEEPSKEAPVTNRLLDTLHDFYDMLETDDLYPTMNNSNGPQSVTDNSDSPGLLGSLPSQNHTLENVNNSKYHQSSEMYKVSENDEQLKVHPNFHQTSANGIGQQNNPFVPAVPEIVIYNDNE